jgi:flagella basal body P-ring formation protein FlgA
MPFSRTRTLLIVSVLAACPVYGAVAGDAEALVARAARAWLADWTRQEKLIDARVDVSVLPNRRPAPQCGQAMKVAVVDTSQPSRLRFTARCPDGAAETYTVRATVHAKVYAALTAIAAGRAIGEGELRRVDADVALTPDAVRDVADAIGWTSQRPLRAGQVVQARFLTAGEGVRRGQAVRIVSRHSGFEVAMAGTAMQKGDSGATVRVRNDATGKSILARVVGPGEVEPALAGAARAD